MVGNNIQIYAEIFYFLQDEILRTLIVIKLFTKMITYPNYLKTQVHKISFRQLYP